jgi:hypothetical protein
LRPRPGQGFFLFFALVASAGKKQGNSGKPGKPWENGVKNEKIKSSAGFDFLSKI